MHMWVQHLASKTSKHLLVHVRSMGMAQRWRSWYASWTGTKEATSSLVLLSILRHTRSSAFVLIFFLGIYPDHWLFAKRLRHSIILTLIVSSGRGNSLACEGSGFLFLRSFTSFFLTFGTTIGYQLFRNPCYVSATCQNYLGASWPCHAGDHDSHI